MTTIVAGALVFLLVGCGGERPGQDVSPDTAMVVSDDPELRAAAARLLPDLARRSGLELREPVRVARRDRASLVRYLEAKLDEELPPDRARRMTLSYHLLGLVPADLELRRILVSVYTEQVAGFYDPDSTALFVMDDQSAESLESVLVHELVHAVQDQAAGLDSLTAPERGNDRQVAAQAAIEGHATLVMLEYLFEQAQGRPVDLSELPDFGQQIRPALEALRSQYPALAGAPEVIRESLLFPYLEGAGFVQRLWRAREGRPGPFGPNLPESTEQVLHPARILGDPPDAPTRVSLALADGGGTITYENGLGEMETGILLKTLAGPAAREAATGWDGDRYVLVEMPDGASALAWLTVWDSVDARDRFVETLRPGIGGLPEPSRLAPVEVEGRPGALLEVGGPPAVEARLGGEG